MPTQELPPHRQILQMMCGYWISRMIYVAAKLRLANAVETQPKTADELAKETATDSASLYRLLRALASVGIFAEDDQSRFGLTPLAETLIDRPGSQWAPAIMFGESQYHAWTELLHSVRTGKTSFDHVYHQPVFEYLAAHPDEAEIFDAAMSGIHGPENAAILEAYDFSGINTLVDVGGGNGSVILSILGKYPALRGILYDVPNVIERSRHNVEKAGLTDRCACATGNFFESVPAGGDAYFLRHIIHDWYDESCLKILGHIRNVIPATGRLLVCDSVIQPGNGPSFAKLLDLTMMTIPGGKERTEVEFRDLFARASFRLERVVPTTAEVAVLEARPV